MLTQFAITNAKPKARPYKLSDGEGLHLLIQPGGSKLWRFRYQFVGKEKMISLGAFPEVSLAEARGKREDARKLVGAGIDPSQKKKEDRRAVMTAAQNTFGGIAAEQLAKLEAEGAAKATMAKNRWLLEDLAAPLAIGQSLRSNRSRYWIFSGASNGPAGVRLPTGCAGPSAVSSASLS